MPDWDLLKQRSIRPGGFGEERITIWPEVLNVGASDLPSKSVQEVSSDTVGTPQAHRDEHQILLDTDRSFVFYPVVDNKNKDEMKARLNELIVSIFRRRPRLNYYQGYHDIISVIFLTLPQDVQLLCAEKMSLSRLRDSMGHTLDPVVGLLRVLKKLICLADPSYAAILNRNMPLPYYALSSLLTLFSHDVPTLPLAQHVFDFLLVRPPIAAVYLTAAIVLSRKDEVYQLEVAGEEGMLHALLTSLPELYEEDTEDLLASDEKVDINGESIPELGEKYRESLVDPTLMDEPADTQHSVKGNQSDIGDTLTSNEQPPPYEQPNPVPESMLDSSIKLESLATPASCDATLVSETPTLHTENNKPDTDDLADSFEDQIKRRRSRVSLTSLLMQTDELCSRFPPSHPDLCLDLIMGPKSVIFTWSETAPISLSDSDAEEIVDKPETVVLHYVDPDERPPQKKRQQVERRWALLASLIGTRLKKRTVLACVVLILGVAISMYGTRTGSPNGYRGNRQEVKKLTRWVGGILLRGWFD